ncbi:hypothetical protein Syun_027964 [Stephania yunnanensis]|uniref:Uncharacterized protein n=1 Tax=Stephania yunnanensis TaxID=152371 RepID=A0AAP0ENT4_9MAGN
MRVELGKKNAQPPPVDAIVAVVAAVTYATKFLSLKLVKVMLPIQLTMEWKRRIGLHCEMIEELLNWNCSNPSTSSARKLPSLMWIHKIYPNVNDIELDSERETYGDDGAEARERGDGRAGEENGESDRAGATRKRSHRHPRRCRETKKETGGGVVEGDDERSEARRDGDEDDEEEEREARADDDERPEASKKETECEMRRRAAGGEAQ